MRKTCCLIVFIGGLTLILLSSCSTTSDVSVTSGTGKIDKRAIVEAPVELPGGYDVEDFRRLRIGLSYGTIQSNTTAFKKQEIMDFMNLRFQSEMHEHKRFIILALHGANTAKFDALTELGEMEANDEDDSARYQRPEINLTWNINIQTERVPDGKYGQLLRWKCTVNATGSYYENVMKLGGSEIKYHKGDVAFKDDFDLPFIEKRQKFSASGKLIEGFNFESDADVQGLMQEIVIAASQRIADDLGRKFPVGGRVIGALGTDLFTIDKGVEQGVEKGMEMTIFARYDGVDVPLANATASPAQDKSQLKVWRLANDKYARQILSEINGHPKQWCQNTGNELFGVRAVPIQDSSKGTRFEE